MTERGLLFKPDMALAAHEGRKTVTRRIGERFRKWVVGDTLIVKETHWRWGRYQRNARKKWIFQTGFRVYEPEVIFHAPELPPDEKVHFGYHKRSALFLPFAYARTRGTITSVRAELLQEVTDMDAIREGIAPLERSPGFWPNWTTEIPLLNARDSFAELWDSINGERYPWANNDMAWRIQWELLT